MSIPDPCSQWLQEREETAHRPEQGGLRGDLQTGRRRPRGEGRGPAPGLGQRQVRLVEESRVGLGGN